MALFTEFDRELNALWQDRIAKTRSLLKKPKGRPKSFSQKDRDKRIGRLKELAASILTKEKARSELQKIASFPPKRKSLRGNHRYDKMLTWAKNFSGPIVYSFWRKKKCLYIGQSESAKQRMPNYRNNTILNKADRLKVHVIRRKTELGKAECLAIHLYNPSGNRADPPKKKYDKRCPVCCKIKKIIEDIDSLFRMK